MTLNIAGILVAPITPFTEDDELDEIALKEHIRFLMESGISGVFTTGTYGAGPLLSKSDYMKVIEISSKEVGGKGCMIANIGTGRTKDGVELCRFAGTNAFKQISRLVK